MPSTIDPWGILSRYKDGCGTWHTITTKTRAAIRAAMGGQNDKPKTGLKTLAVGEKFILQEPGELRLEDGTSLRCERELPRDLPVGYHELTSDSLKVGFRTTRLIVTPGSCYLPDALRVWGWAAQLYALRSRASWGMGDFRDLQTFARRTAEQSNAQFILINPLGAATPTLPQQASPYYPGSRRFLNPLYLRVEEVPGARESAVPLAKLAEAGRALNENRLINRNAVFKLKMAALEKIWHRFPGNPQFERFCQQNGKALAEFAVFCALAEHFQSGWTKWPQAYQRPDAPAVKKFTQEQARRIRFHQWLQWLAQTQLARAEKALPIMQDLPIGVDPAGADAWVWQDLLARDMSIGAPPDAYNANGQDWGLPPFIPARLRAAGYEPFRQTIRAALRCGGGLRIDHVMGLFRLFWIPKKSSPRDGAFVHYPHEELLSVLAVESHRAKAWVVGEDLGTVGPGVRAELRRRKILSYRLLWFESKPVKKFPRQALAAATTHDLYTVAGLWTGSDLAAQKKIGMKPDEADRQKTLQRLRRRLHLPAQAKTSAAIIKTHQLLAQAPSAILTATLDDALAVAERPNMPGTTTEWPNWSLALPVPLEEIHRKPLVRKIARICGRRRSRLKQKRGDVSIAA